jgi:hypothetical protein
MTLANVVARAMSAVAAVGVGRQTRQVRQPPPFHRGPTHPPEHRQVRPERLRVRHPPSPVTPMVGSTSEVGVEGVEAGEEDGEAEVEGVVLGLAEGGALAEGLGDGG